MISFSNTAGRKNVSHITESASQIPFDIILSTLKIIRNWYALGGHAGTWQEPGLYHPYVKVG